MDSKRKKIRPDSYRKRDYRLRVETGGLCSFMVRIRETDLHILAGTDLTTAARDLVLESRSHLESYLTTHPRFLASLVPLPEDRLAPPIVREMLLAGQAASVGPMAAVAGAVAEAVGRGLLQLGTAEVVVENGGDVFLMRNQACVVGIFAGASPLSNRVGIKLSPDRMPLGVCTSSGTVGHSLSFGRADSATVLAPSAALADAVATRLGNEIKADQDIDRALTIARSIPGVLGAVLISGDRLGAWGELELVRAA